jgi:hypothetical protein
MRLVGAALILVLSAAPAAGQTDAAAPLAGQPVFLEQTGRTHEAPPSVADLAYASRLRASYASAQGFQGPLDGGWTLAGEDGAPLYGLKVVDRGDGVIEGAWRDLRRTGALAGSGFIEAVRREGGALTLTFGPAVATFTGGYDGVWSGQLTDGGRARAVTLRKDP